MALWPILTLILLAAIIWYQSRERARLIERLDEAHLRTSENVERMQQIVNRITPADPFD